MEIKPDRSDWQEKLKDFDFSGMGERFKGGLTRTRIVLLVILGAILVIIAVILPFSMFYTDALWYNHLGFQNLFWKMFWAQILLVIVFAAAFFAILYGNLLIARRIAPPQKIDVGGSPLEAFVEKARQSLGRIIRIGTVAVCVFASFIAAIGWGGRWELVLKFLNHTDFGKADPLFGKDIGYYLFSYPFLRDLVNWLLGAFFFVFVAIALLYFLTGGIRLRRGPEMLAPHVKAHLSVLLAIIFLIKAWSYRLNMYELLFTKDGAVYGAGYTDVKARLPALWILTVLSILAAIILIANIKYRGWLLPAIAVGSLVVVTILAGSVYPLIVQNYRVKPNERELESPYLKYNIDFTRLAYKIDKIATEPFAAELNLDLAGIERNITTVRNIRLWDPRPLLDTFQQIQAIRQYYMFNDVDVDRYTIDGVYRQTMIAAREILQENLPEEARTWVNKKLVYTHGYGACLCPSNDVTDEGNPNLLIKDIPPVGSTDLQITRPEIYFGEKTTDYVTVDTSEKEFDYPKGDEKVYTNFKGEGGVRVNSFWRRVLFAVNFRDVNFLFSGQIKNSSQVMYYRSVSERVRKSAPFINFDRDPYLVIDDSGRLFWIVDGYTTSDSFPYSQPTSGFGRYVRNSVKAVVDAYNGKVRLYVVDPDDPVIATYRKIFPQIFTSFDRMPEGLKKHIRYPEDYFLVQANMLRTYHMTDPREFYNKEDEWDFPQESYDGKQPMTPYYVIMRLPGQEKEETVLLIPFTPHNKQNMIAWLGARMDPGKYGDMINYTFPSGKLIYGPEQIEGRIEQDPEISRQLSLWRQAGSQVIRGNLLVIPIEQSLIYVMPLYLQATQIKIPQIKRVVVVYGDSVVMEKTLEAAISRLFTGAPAEEVRPPEEKPPSKMEDLSEQALDLYNKAVEAQRAGDWGSYGKYLDQLKEVLDKMNQAAP